MTRLSDETLTEAASYIALWLAIHGGDPGPQSTLNVGEAKNAAAQIAHTMTAYLASLSETASANAATLAHRFEKAGISRVDGHDRHENALTCVSTKYGVAVCIPGGGGEKAK